MSQPTSTTAAVSAINDHPNITVIGTGYLGATHAICMAVLGYEVLGVDVDAAKIEQLSSGHVPVLRAGPARDAAGRPWPPGSCGSPPTSPRPREFGDVHFICVGTPAAARAPTPRT